MSRQTGWRWVRRAGVSRLVGRPRGVSVSSHLGWQDTGVLIDTDAPAGYRLGWADRQEIALGYNRGESMTAIAARIKRPVCTVSREIKRNVSPDGVYRLTDAHRDSVARAKRTKPAKLAQPGRLRDYVVAQLKKKRSPEQIASRIALEYPDDPEMRVCHETIYQAIYIQARGGLKREVDKALRRGRGYRKPQRKPDTRRTRVPDELLISQRPDDVADRLIPGHWEGDLILGSVASGSAVATLVERSTRFVMLGHLPADHTATTVRDAIVPLLAGLPDQMRKTLTWDQGSEMACHLQIAEQADINVYFAHPHSPWERGTNEATNGLLRQYLPKGTDLSIYTPTDLQAIADELNSRPRKTLGWLTPEEAWHLTLGHTITIGGRQMALPDTLQPLQQRCIHP